MPPRRSVSFDLVAHDQISATYERVAGATEKLKAKVDRTFAKAAELKIDADDKGAQAKILAVQAKLVQLDKTAARPNLDVAGTARAEAQIAALDAQLDEFGKKREVATVAVNDKASHGMTRIYDAALALAPLLAPVGAAGVGAGISVAGGFAAAGLGAAAFLAPAAKAATQIAKTADAADDNASALDGLSTQQRSAVRNFQKLTGAWKQYQAQLQPETFTALSKGEGIAEDALKHLQPVAKSAGKSLIGLEGDAKKALNSRFYSQFFGYLQNEGSHAVTSFGRTMGHVGSGFAGLFKAFQPVERNFENGLERLSGRFDKFGRTAQKNKGVQDFIDYIDTEGPQVVHVLGQFASTFGQVARDAAPVGKIELEVVDDTLKIVDAVAKANPLLIQLGGGLYAAHKATKALKLTSTVSGLFGIASGSKAAADVFPKVTSAGGKAGKVLGTIGGALGLVGPYGKLAGAGLIAAGVGIGYLTDKLITAKSGNEKYYESLQKQFHATGNNVKAYKTLTEQAKNQAKASSKEGDLVKHNAKNYEQYRKVTGQFALSQDQLAAAQQRAHDQQNKNDYAYKKGQHTLKVLTSNADQVAHATNLSRSGALKLADSLGINLSKKAGVTTKQMQKLKLANIDNRDAALKAADPIESMAAANEILGDKSATTQEKIDALNTSIANEHQQSIDATSISAQFGDTMSQLSGVLGKNTSHAKATAAAHAILSGDVSRAGSKTRQMAELLGQASSQFKTYTSTALSGAHGDKGLAKASQNVIDKHKSMVSQLERTLEKMGVSKDAAHKLAEKYLAIPKNVTTTAHFHHGAADDAVRGFTSNLRAHLDSITNTPWKIQMNGSVGEAGKGTYTQSKKALAAGGYVSGPGTGTSDSIPAMLSNGEFVVNAASTRKHLALLEAINRGIGFAGGGLAGSANITAAVSLPTHALEARIDAVTQSVLRKLDRLLPTMPAGGGSRSGLKAYARSLLGQFGWNAARQFPYLDKLWTRESGWNPFAQNPTSTAYGIPQFLNSTWAGYRFPKTSDGRKQIYDGLQYVGGEYGSPAAAWAHEVAYGFYKFGGLVQKKLRGLASGGFIAPGEIALVGEGGHPEIVQGGRAGATVTPVSRADAELAKLIGSEVARQVGPAVHNAINGAELKLEKRSGRVIATLAADPHEQRRAGLSR